MIVLMPIALIWSKKLCVTGADESTASTRGSVMQKSAARALATQTAKLATNKHENLAGLPAKRLSAGMASPDRTPRQRFKHTIYIQINSGLAGKGNQPNLAIPAKAGTHRSAAADSCRSCSVLAKRGGLVRRLHGPRLSAG